MIWARAREHEIDIGTLTGGTVRTVADAMREYEKRVSPTKRPSRWEAIRFRRLNEMKLTFIQIEDAFQRAVMGESVRALARDF